MTDNQEPQRPPEQDPSTSHWETPPAPGAGQPGQPTDPWTQPQPTQEPWGQQQPATPWQQQQQPAQWTPAATNPYDSETTPVLVTGILSLVLCGLIGIYAWMQGNALRDRANAAGYPEPQTGKVGRILGIIGTVLGVLQLAVVGIYVLIFTIAIASSA